jgi:hypothetical protein
LLGGGGDGAQPDSQGDGTPQALKRGRGVWKRQDTEAYIAVNR